MRRGIRTALTHSIIVCITVAAVLLLGRENGSRMPEALHGGTMENLPGKMSGTPQRETTKNLSGETPEALPGDASGETVTMEPGAEPAGADLWNQQGATQTGGEQVYLADRGTVLGRMGQEMDCFDEAAQKLRFFCDDRTCLHTGGSCPAKSVLCYLLSDSTAVYGVADGARREIRRIQGNQTECLYRADQNILGLWGYRDDLYYMTEFGVYRFSADDPSDVLQVLDRPVEYEFITFYGDRMYFVTEDEFLYEAGLDGSEKKRLVDEKAVSPQVCDGILYYRCAEYDENGVFQMDNALKGIFLADGSVETILDAVYRFSVVPEEKKIYYTELPDYSKSRLSCLKVLDLETGDDRQITECLAGTEISVFPESDWIIYEMPEGEYDLYHCCIRKDGSGQKRLEYPKGVGA